MRYPKLRTLTKDFEPSVVATLDSWLGEKGAGVVSPSQFTADCGVSRATALLMFAHAAQPEVGVLDLFYRIKCPQCGCNVEMDSEATVFCPGCNCNCWEVGLQVKTLYELFQQIHKLVVIYIFI